MTFDLNCQKISGLVHIPGLSKMATGGYEHEF